ncbi:uncharacterized protein [Primulina huaijiensis]|uniref:uncharacterized protein n=1 Tax=Primulina huaijiensis TaxID=1492673 RepID=UPI003CC6EE76
MSSRYDHQRVHLQKPIFLPIICRLSIKDVEPNNHHRRRIQKLDVPSSPRVSCIGQVKSDNRITVLPFNVAAPAPNANHHKQKLKKPRSSGTLLLSTTNGGGGGARGGVSRSCRTSKEEMIVNNSTRIKLTNSGYQDRVKELNIGELDPPLPVVKRVVPPPGVGRDEVNLWRRRCLRGAELKSLQIKQKHLPNNNFEPPPTV